MSETARTVRPKAPAPAPAPARVGRALYGEAFEARSAEDLSDAIADWAALDNAERSFAIAHLLYLGLQAQGRIAHHLGRARQQLDTLSEDLQELLEDLTAPSGGGQGDPSDLPDAERLTAADTDETANS